MKYKIGDKVKIKRDGELYVIYSINKYQLIAIKKVDKQTFFYSFTFDEVEEVWRNLKDYEGLYEISSLGRVRSADSGYVYKQNESNGYLKMDLRKNSVRRAVKVHRLVAETFISNPLNKDQVNHIDGDKHNNNVANLEWVTQSENQIHAIDNGHRKCRAVEHRNEIIEDYKSGEMSFRELIKKYRTSKPPVIRILKGAGLPVGE